MGNLNERGRREVRRELKDAAERMLRQADTLSAQAAALELQSADLRRGAAAVQAAIEIIDRASQEGD